jgi:glycopeptide antibiotics resistance protein
MTTAEGLWEFMIGPPALAVLAVTALVAWPVGRRLADRFRSRRAVAVLFVIAVGIVAALTLTPNFPEAGVPEPLPPHYLTQIDEPRVVWSALTAAPSDAEEIANVALYVPVGVLGWLLWRSVGWATLFGAMLTVVIETCQIGVIGRAGSLTDIRNNTAGAFLGAVFAAAVVWVMTRISTARRPIG